MKTTIKFNLGEVNANVQGQNVNLKDISGEMTTTYTMKDIIGSYGLLKDMVDDVPELLESLTKGYDKFQEIEKKYNPKTEDTVVAPGPNWDIKSMSSEEISQEEIDRDIAEACYSAEDTMEEEPLTEEEFQVGLKELFTEALIANFKK